MIWKNGRDVTRRNKLTKEGEKDNNEKAIQKEKKNKAKRKKGGNAYKKLAK